jgi:hypothetical protein
MSAAYLDRACVLRVEVDYGLSPTGDLDLVLRTEPRHDYIVLQSVCHIAMFRTRLRRTFDCVPVATC